MRFVVLGFLVLAGCSSASADWHGDKRFSPAERAAIEDGAAWLAEQSHTPVPSIAWDYEVTGSGVLPNTIRRETGPHASGECFGGAVYLGLDAPGVRSVDVPGLVAHELAHCELGFVDDPETDGLMRVVTPVRWTDREREQCAKLGTCG